MLACGHERSPFGAPLCVHLRNRREPSIQYVKWYVGCGLDAEFLCVPCADGREKGVATEATAVCEECFDYATTEVGDLVAIRGKPETRTRCEHFANVLKETAIPKHVGLIVDIAPVACAGRSVWLMLADSGVLTRFDADTGDIARIAFVDVPPETDHKPWAGRVLRRRLHASDNVDFAAVVNDYGRYGSVVDLASGQVTFALDGGDYHPETVPFSFAFAKLKGRVVAIHRTDWNRLDVSDPSSGVLLSVRGPTSYRRGETCPEHYLDYFHGGIYVSPCSSHIVDDGWVWHPVGIPTTWSLDRWLSENVWESEDGSSKKHLCSRDYYWDHAIAWIDEHRVAVGGIGEDDNLMIEGARIFDVTLTGSAGTRWTSACEISAFAGPAGIFFSDGTWLYSSDERGLSRWDFKGGACTGHLPKFRPTHHHRSAAELVQLIDGTLLRWRMSA